MKLTSVQLEHPCNIFDQYSMRLFACRVPLPDGDLCPLFLCNHLTHPLGRPH